MRYLSLTAISVATLVGGCAHVASPRPACDVRMSPGSPRFWEQEPDEWYQFTFEPPFGKPAKATVMSARAIFTGEWTFPADCPSEATPRPVSPDEWAEIVSAIDASGFWAHAGAMESRVFGIDGDEWTLQGTRHGVHKRARLSCNGGSLPIPPDEAALCRAMDRMMRLAGAPEGWAAR